MKTIKDLKKERLSLITRLNKLKEEYIYIDPILVDNKITGFKICSETNSSEFLGKLDKFPQKILDVGADLETYSKISYIISLVEINKKDLDNVFKPIREDGYVRGKSHVAGYFKLVNIISEESRRLVIKSLKEKLKSLKDEKGLIIVPRSVRNIYDGTIWTTSVEIFKLDSNTNTIFRSSIKALTNPFDIFNDIDDFENLDLDYKKVDSYDKDLENVLKSLFENNNLDRPERIISLLKPEEIFEFLYNKSIIYFLTLVP